MDNLIILYSSLVKKDKQVQIKRYAGMDKDFLPLTLHKDPYNNLINLLTKLTSDQLFKKIVRYFHNLLNLLITS